jgi:hypothetical protein
MCRRKSLICVVVWISSCVSPYFLIAPAGDSLPNRSLRCRSLPKRTPRGSACNRVPGIGLRTESPAGPLACVAAAGAVHVNRTPPEGGRNALVGAARSQA